MLHIFAVVFQQWRLVLLSTRSLFHTGTAREGGTERVTPSGPRGGALTGADLGEVCMVEAFRGSTARGREKDRLRMGLGTYSKKES